MPITCQGLKLFPLSGIKPKAGYGCFGSDGAPNNIDFGIFESRLRSSFCYEAVLPGRIIWNFQNDFKRYFAMISAMIKSTAKVIKEMPWWQKVILGAAAVIAFSATAKAMEYFIQEIEEPEDKKPDKFISKT